MYGNVFDNVQYLILSKLRGKKVSRCRPLTQTYCTFDPQSLVASHIMWLSYRMARNRPCSSISLFHCYDRSVSLSHLKLQLRNNFNDRS